MYTTHSRLFVNHGFEAPQIIERMSTCISDDVQAYLLSHIPTALTLKKLGIKSLK